MKFTVLGSTGFIGSAMTKMLMQKGYEVYTPERSVQSLAEENLGHVIYAIGMTGNFRADIDNTIEAHVALLKKYLKNATFESWLYLSSTRVYGTDASTTSELQPLKIIPSADSIYDLSKLLGEAICLSHNNPKTRIARLSNVYGVGQNQNMFLGSILHDLQTTGETMIKESPQSSKNYIYLDDAIEILEKIALYGTERLYNVASATNTSHGEIAALIAKHGYKVNFCKNGPTRIFPSIDIDKIHSEFGKKPSGLIEILPTLLKH